MKRTTSLLAIGALAALTGSAMGVGDCCTAKVTTAQNRNELVNGWTCATNWTASHRDDGKFCFPLGAGYGAGISSTLTVGQEFELNASFTLGNGGAGVTVGAATKFTVSQAFSHTAPAGQNCQLYLSHDNAVMVHWTAQRFCVVGNRTFTTTSFTSFGTTTVIPCCEPAGGGRPGAAPPDGGANQAEQAYASGPDYSSSPRSTLIFDLRGQPSFEPNSLPSWHPMNQPGSSLSTLNGWERREIMRGVREAEEIQGHPIAELVIFDTDGSFEIWDLEADPSGLVPCVADTNSDGLFDQADVTLFVNYFLSSDPAADIDGSELLDLSDVTAFAESALAGCP